MVSTETSAQKSSPSPKKPVALNIRLRIVAIIITLLILGYGGISFLVAYIITIPPRLALKGTPEQQDGLAYQDVTFPSRHDNVPISAWFIPKDGSSRVVILVHGKGQTRTQEFNGCYLEVAAMLHERGFNILMLDLRGHGKSGDARFTYAIRERYDVLGAVDWLQKQGFSAGSMGVLGVSMGAASSIHAAAEEPAIGAVVSDSAFAEFLPIVERAFTQESGLPPFFLPSTVWAIGVLTGEDVALSRPVAVLGNIAPRPVLLIHAKGDELIPVDHAYQLQAALPGSELWIVPVKEHAKTFNADKQAYSERVGGFFETHLK
jgi:pimeloyl-ACP methyl ester carboxylesterase